MSEEVADLDAAAALDGSGVDPHRLLAALRDRHRRLRWYDIGYPLARDIDYGPVEELAAEGVWNNIGDPAVDPPGGNHTKPVERALLTWAADLFGFPADPGQRWGYTTTGGHEANEAALRHARDLLPGAVALYSTAAHYSVPKALTKLAVRGVPVAADAGGAMHYRDLADRVAAHRDRPVIVVLTAGTTMTEAVDDPDRVRDVLDRARVTSRYVHVDAALSGIPLALTGELDLAAADSVAVSGYKFLGTPRVCGVVLGRRRVPPAESHIDYVATTDSTLTGSRDGLAPLQMWWAVRQLSNEGLRARALAARGLAQYAVDQLNAAGCPAWRHPHAMTVVIPSPPAAVARRWKLAHAPRDGISHLICMPGTTYEQVDAFVQDVADTVVPYRIPLPRHEAGTVRSVRPG